MKRNILQKFIYFSCLFGGSIDAKTKNDGIDGGSGECCCVL